MFFTVLAHLSIWPRTPQTPTRGNTAKQHGSMRNMELARLARLAGLAMLAMARAIRAVSVALSAQPAPRSRPITAAMSGIPRARLLEAQLAPYYRTPC